MNKTLLAAGLAATLAAALSGCDREASPEPVDKVQDAVSVPVGQVSAATLGANTVAGYVPNAAMGDMYEIAAADLASERSQNARIKALAAMIKADHTAASDRFKGLVPTAAPGTALPTALDERRQGLIDNLRSAAATGFDATWIDQQIAAHKEALTLHRGFADNAEAPPLAEHARTVTPKVEAHLREAEAIKAAMAG